MVGESRGREGRGREGRGSGSYRERVWEVVRAIPPGQVATYGQLARLAGRCTARMAGYALAAVPDGSGIPWHRVVNAQGRISVRSSGEPSVRQRLLLEAEGVVFDPGGRIDLRRFGWR
ncbi:MAG: MGMT family protein [bacterium]